jgi:hypothetical protein
MRGWWSASSCPTALFRLLAETTQKPQTDKSARNSKTKQKQRLLARAASASEDDFAAGRLRAPNLRWLHKYRVPVVADLALSLAGSEFGLFEGGTKGQGVERWIGCGVVGFLAHQTTSTNTHNQLTNTFSLVPRPCPDYPPQPKKPASDEQRIVVARLKRHGHGDQCCMVVDAQ